MAAPLRLLTEQSAVFTWQSKQESVFQLLKTIITKAPVLKFYDVHDEATIQCDASEKGLGATLLQQGQPVAFVSRSLMKAKQNYAQIEKSVSPLCLCVNGSISIFMAENRQPYILTIDP